MTNRPTIRTMNRDDVHFAIRLATKEGWNPGLSDAESFYSADPEGFFISELNDHPVGTISAIRYGDDFGFVGLYIMSPEARGKGFGMELWNHAMEHLEGCTVGLDPVTEQDATYKRSGFTPHYRSTRFEGKGHGAAPEDVTPMESIDFEVLEAYDRTCFPGPRPGFLLSWLDSAGVTGYGVMDGDRLAGYGIIRPCVSGYKIGPLFADTPDVAESIYTALAAAASSEKIYLDVIEPNSAAVDLTRQHGLEPVFTTVRMYKGDEPDLPLDRIFGVTSFELG